MKLTAVCFLSWVLWIAQRQPAAQQNVETILNIAQQGGSLTKLIQTDLAMTCHTCIKLQVQSSQKQDIFNIFKHDLEKGKTAIQLANPARLDGF